MGRTLKCRSRRQARPSLEGNAFLIGRRRQRTPCAKVWAGRGGPAPTWSRPTGPILGLAMPCTGKTGPDALLADGVLVDPGRLERARRDGGAGRRGTADAV